MSDLLDGLRAIRQAKPGYLLAEDYYEGRIEEYFANDRLGLALTRGRGGRQRYMINFAKTPVNVLADRLEVAAVSVVNDPAATQLLQEEFWDANQLALEIPEALKKTLIYGDGYLFVWDSYPESGGVNVAFNSPLNTRAMYDPENEREILYVAKTWTMGDLQRATLYYPDRIERYVTAYPSTLGESESDWIPYLENDGEAWPMYHDHGLPLFHLRTALPYGRPIHRDAYGPQDALTKLVVTMMETVDAAGTPWRFGLLRADAALTGESSVSPRWNDDAEALDTDRGQSKISGRPGEFSLLDGVESVGQLDAADPKHFLDPAQFILRAMAQTTGTPLHNMDPTGDVPSGESRRAQDAPLVKTTRFLQMLLGSAITRAAENALDRMGKHGVRVEVRWVSPVSTDDGDAWNTVLVKKETRLLPDEQILLESGYSADQIQAWREARGDESVQEKIDLALQAGKAGQALGAAVSMGTLDPDVAKAVIGTILLPLLGKDDAVDQLLTGDASAQLGPEALAIMVQKLYLGVDKIITADEARAIINQAGGNLEIGAGPVAAG